MNKFSFLFIHYSSGKRTMMSWVCLIMTIYTATAQQNFIPADPNVFAHYPLDGEGSKILRLYDISVNGHHGSFFNGSVDDLSAIYQVDKFITGASCINKSKRQPSHISIDNLYKGVDFKTSMFGMSFWINVDAELLAREYGAPVLQFPAFNLVLGPSGTSGQALSLYVTTAGPSALALRIPINTKGWYFISFFSTMEASQYRIQSYSYCFSGTDIRSYDPLAVALTSLSQIAVAPSVPTGKDRDTASIMSAAFTGKLWNLRFYNNNLGNNVTLINKYRNADWYNSLEETYAGLGPDWAYPVLSTPVAYYPCSKAASTPAAFLRDLQSERDSYSSKSVYFVTDRFGKADNSIEFTSVGNIGLIPFYSSVQTVGKKVLPAYDLLKGYTISFWTYIDKSLYPPDDGSIPFTDEDHRFQFVFFSSNNKVMGGLSYVRDRLVVNRFMPMRPPRPWELWLWDPVSFQDMKGWYHVILAQKENAMRVVVYKPNGEKAIRLNYFNPQSYEALTIAGLGNPNSIPGDHPIINAARSLDDIRFYNWPLSEEQAEWLHISEMVKPPTP